MGHFMSCESGMREARTNTHDVFFSLPLVGRVDHRERKRTMSRVVVQNRHQPLAPRQHQPPPPDRRFAHSRCEASASLRTATEGRLCTLPTLARGREKKESAISLHPQARAARLTLAAAAIVFAFGLALSTDASAQQCTPTGNNQTCTNSIALTGGAIGLSDANTLTVTNTNTGTITGTDPANAFGILATTANVNNTGTVTATAMGAGGTTFATGIDAVTTANVTNTGAITATATATAAGSLAEAFGIRAFTTANVTNAGTITATATGGA